MSFSPALAWPRDSDVERYEQPGTITSVHGARLRRHPRIRVLCADDHELTRECLCTFLDVAGFDVLPAEDGERAWELLNQHGADVLVTDHVMPRLSGLDLIARVRAAGFRLPVVLAYGSLDHLVRHRAGEAELAGVLLKPYSQRQLVAVVEHALGNRGGPTPAELRKVERRRAKLHGSSRARATLRHRSV